MSNESINHQFPLVRPPQILSSPGVSAGDPLEFINLQSGFPPEARRNDKVVLY